MGKTKINMYSVQFSGRCSRSRIKLYSTTSYLIMENILFHYQYHRKVPMRYFFYKAPKYFLPFVRKNVTVIMTSRKLIKRIRKQDILQHHLKCFLRFSCFLRDLFFSRSRVKLEAIVFDPASMRPGFAVP